MGANCAKGSFVQPSKESQSQYSQIRLLDRHPKPSNSRYRFQIKLRNVCLSSFEAQLYEIVFEFDQNSKVLFSQSEMNAEGKLKFWKTERICHFQLNQHQLIEQTLNIIVYWRNQQKVQLLPLKFNQLCRGPIHHDHLLPEMKSRIVFDLQIHQLIDMKISCSNFKLIPHDKTVDKLSISSDLIVNTATQHTSKSGHSKGTKFIKLNQSISMQEKMLHSELKQSSLRIILWEEHKGSRVIFAEVYIPYEKFVGLCSSYTTQNKSGSTFIKRTHNWEQRLKKQKQIKFTVPKDLNQLANSIEHHFFSFKLIWEITQTYVEQLEGVIWSEKGINTVSPYLLKGQGGYSVFAKIQNAQLNIKQLKGLLSEFKTVKSNKKIKQEKKVLQKTYKSLTQTTKLSQLVLEDETPTIQYQFLLLEILEQISSFLEQGQYLINENIWKIFNVIIRRAQLSIRYLHAIDSLKDKKKIGIKFYKFICSILTIIVRSTGIGITFKELKYSQKFIAYCFFRYPWMQRRLILNIQEQNDPMLSVDRLAELGACLGVKSPSKNMVFDWQSNLFNFIRKEQEYISAEQKLLEITESLPDWSNMLFNHEDEQLYFGGLSQLINEAELTLNYQGRILWEYFPQYDKIIGRFEAQMKNNQPLGFTEYFQEFAVKLMRNQKLLNTFMKHLFSKTFLYQTYSVMRCIQIIRLCFEMLVTKNNSKLPTNFNYSLFARGIISILQIKHSHLVLRTLNVLFKYYNLLSKECQYQIEDYFFSNSFFDLFLHWNHLCRKIYMCFLLKYLIPKYKHHGSLMKNGRQAQVSDQGIQNYYKYKEIFSLLSEKAKQSSAIKVHQEKLPKIADEYFYRMKKKLVKMKNGSQWNETKNMDLMNVNTLQLNRLGSYRNSRDYCDDKEIRPRKWSSQIYTNYFKIPIQLENYLQAAQKEYQILKNSENGLQQEVQEIVSNFSKKKKIDEKQ